MQISDLVIVCPAHIPTLQQIKNKHIVVKTKELSTISEIRNVLNKNNNKLSGIILLLESLDLLDLKQDISDVAMRVYSKRIGSYSDFRQQIDDIKNKNITFFFPANGTESYIDAKILSTIGLNAGIDINTADILWQDLIDLTIHSIYSRASHTIIEPVKFFLDNYKAADVNVQAIYFNDESYYIHADENLNFAFSESDLANKNIVAVGIDELHSESTSAKYLSHVSKWHEHFIKHTKCSVCPAWKMCQGRFESECLSGSIEPVEFYSEIITALTIENNK